LAKSEFERELGFARRFLAAGHRREELNLSIGGKAIPHGVDTAAADRKKSTAQSFIAVFQRKFTAKSRMLSGKSLKDFP
jgi:uncharacterized phosphosugar-binding protein